MIDIQITAAEVVGATLDGRNLDRALELGFKRHGDLPREARAAVQSIAYDSLRNYGLINAQLETLLSAPLSDVAVRHLLIITLAQLQFSKTKPHVIVDHAVNAAEKMGLGRAKGLVNGVLRNYLREVNKFKRERFKSEVARYDFPEWWIARTKVDYPDNWEEILLCAAEHPPMCLRVNRKKCTAEEYVALLAKNEMQVAHVEGDALWLTHPCNVDALPKFREGYVSVQDAGAQHTAALLNCGNGMRVLDACAAPGGKTCQLLETATNLTLTALDSDPSRLQRVKQNLDRLQLATPNVTLKSSDAAVPDKWWDKKPFDRILLDVPCTGSGVVRRHPDIKWVRRPTDTAKFVIQQGRLLAGVWPTLKKGGQLLYVTCSIFHEENQDVVNAFLAKTADAKLKPIKLASAEDALNTGTLSIKEKPQAAGQQLLPDDMTDGFYYALIEKV